MSAFTVDNIKSAQDTDVILNVRVCYRKEICSANYPGKPWKIEFVLIDVTGNKIQGSIVGAAVVNKFGKLLTEGSIVEIKGVMINPNVDYRVTRHLFKIQLTLKTSVCQIVNDPPVIPMFKFEEYEKILSAPATFAGFNIDVIGHVIRDQDSVTRKVEGVEAQMMSIIIENIEGHTIQLTLWGEHCVRLQNLLADRLTQKDVIPLVVILQMGKVKVFGNQAPTVQTVKNQSRFLTDVEIPEIRKYLDKLMKRPKAELSASMIVKRMDSSSSAVFSDDLQSGIVPIVNICDVPELPEGEYWVLGKVMDVDTHTHWAYLSCKKCTMRVEKIDGIFSCSACKISFSKPFFRFKLSLLIQDHTGFDNFKFWDRTSIMLIDMNATELKMMNEGRPKFELPPQFMELYDRLLLMKVSNSQRKKEKIQDLNVRHLCTDEHIILKYKLKREAELLELAEKNEEDVGDDVDQDDLDYNEVNIVSIGDNEDRLDGPSSSKVTPKRKKYVVLDEDDDEDVPEQEDVKDALKSDGKTQRSVTRFTKKLNSEFKERDENNDDLLGYAADDDVDHDDFHEDDEDVDEGEKEDFEETLKKEKTRRLATRFYLKNLKSDFNKVDEDESDD